jgi:hypothetical protein
MTEVIDIGPCECCGGDGGCVGGCVWHWIYQEDPGMYFWQSEGLCADPPGGGPIRCRCDPPDYPGTELNEEVITPCYAVV